ncbi:MAG: hypothetical protein COA57_02760 [Flavobacteriales bacterium]|nr:MAG: hypothetical protein COA57_02760 [Flavobacteriales bacterium]
MEKLRLLSVVVFAFLSAKAIAQNTFVNTGALVYVGGTSVVHVNGTFTNTGTTATFENNGEVNVDDNSSTANSGKFVIDNSSVVSGDGDYLVEGDWVNNAIFIPQISYVNLDGADQLINGTVSTTFNDLELTGSGIKKQTLDATVINTLALNDRELATDTNTMFVTNPAVNAVTNDQTFGAEGFVSSLGNGALSRETNSTGTYLFPTGSSQGTQRYRAIEITPNSSAANTFALRFVNYDPTLETWDVTSFDSSICLVDSLFCHKIDQTAGSDAADITMYFEPANDGQYDALVQWGAPVTGRWNNMGPVTSSNGLYDALVSLGWSDFSKVPFALAVMTPPAPLITGTDALCSDTEGLVYTAFGTDSTSTYVWNVPPSVIIISGDSTDQIIVDWGDSSGTVTVSEIINGCKSYVSSAYLVNTYAMVVAGFDTANGGYFGDVVSFLDTSINAAIWNWYFGDEGTSYEQHPTHAYAEPGTYEVMLIVEDQYGCLDTVYGMVEVPEDIIIPNIFTPNSDGMNDYFFFPVIGVGEFEFVLYNRWGMELFRTVAPKIEWDGKNAAGRDVPDGTYYYTLKALSPGNDYGHESYLTLMR